MIDTLTELDEYFGIYKKWFRGVNLVDLVG